MDLMISDKFSINRKVGEDASDDGNEAERRAAVGLFNN